jgi:hypothetical protein
MRYNAGADGRGMDELEDCESGPFIDYDRVRLCLSHIPSYRNMIVMATPAPPTRRVDGDDKDGDPNTHDNDNDNIEEKQLELIDDLTDCDPMLPSLMQWILTATSSTIRYADHRIASCDF